MPAPGPATARPPHAERSRPVLAVLLLPVRASAHAVSRLAERARGVVDRVLVSPLRRVRQALLAPFRGVRAFFRRP